MERKDEIIVCKNCQKEFAFTVRDQEFYEEKGFTNKPVRCKDCRIERQKAREKRNKNVVNFNDYKKQNNYEDKKAA